MTFKTVLLDPQKFISLKSKKEEYPRRWEDCTGMKVTDIVGVKKGDDFVLTSRETWKRIELFAEILSAVDMTINEDRLNEVLGGRS